jgi:hypothetical protein
MLKDKVFEMINIKGFRDQKNVHFIYSEVNESNISLPLFTPSHMWSRRGVVPDKVTEGSQLLVANLLESYIEENLEGISSEISRMLDEEGETWATAYLQLIKNHSTDRYGLVFIPIPYASEKDLSPEVLEACRRIAEEK